MELLAICFCIVVGCLDFCIFQKLVLAAGDVDFHKVLIYNSSGAEVEVSYLRVAHLSVRQSDIFAASLKVAERIFFTE